MQKHATKYPKTGTEERKQTDAWTEVIFYSVSEGFITIFLNTLSDIFKSSTMEGIIYYIIISLMLKGVVG